MDGRPDLVRRAAAGAIGAFALVFAGCGATIAEAEHPGTLGVVGIAGVFGLVIMAMVYATGHLSGAHLNPAGTLAFVMTRHMPRGEVLAYIGAVSCSARSRRPACLRRYGRASRRRWASPCRASGAEAPWPTRLF